LAPVLDRDLLAGVEDREPVRNSDQNYYEARAYNYLLVQAHKAGVADLARVARRDLTFAHLFEEPEKYRGEIIHVEGRLKRLRRFDAPGVAVKEGVPTLYEGWIFPDLYMSNPFCVIATEVSPRLTVGDQMDHRVQFDGYFFKRYRYPAGDGLRDAPLLIGRAIQVNETVSAVPPSPWVGSSAMLIGLAVVLIGTIVMTAALAWWFRHGDKKARARLERARIREFVEPEPQTRAD
jgi:hypothetical protein